MVPKLGGDQLPARAGLLDEGDDRRRRYRGGGWHAERWQSSERKNYRGLVPQDGIDAIAIPDDGDRNWRIGGKVLR